jgi:NAD(P)-dependent dehydrogenase (short-subunit alcohol dehydrogenase family)
MDRLDGKVALVTGAASGIGNACARRFAEEGAEVAGLDVAASERWKPAAGPKTSFHVADVRDEAAVSRAVATALAAHGAIDVLVNAAGVSSYGAAHEVDAEEWDRVLDINLKGSYLVAKHVLPAMMARRSGSIIHVASVEGFDGVSGQLAYNASKGGVVLMTKNMALDYATYGIRVNCLCPGLIETPLTAPVMTLPALLEQMRSFHAMERFGKPEEVAAAALFLASDDASFVTGHPLVVDGGWLAGRRLRVTDL